MKKIEEPDSAQSMRRRKSLEQEAIMKNNNLMIQEVWYSF